MQNLLLFAKRVKKFLILNVEDKLLLVKIYVLTAIARIVILIIPFRKYKRHLGILHNESSYKVNEEEFIIASKISWGIGVVSRYTPWQSKCLVQALTAQYLLWKNKIDSTLYLGVGKEEGIVKKSDMNNDNYNKEFKIIAHAWIRCGSLYVTGGNGRNFAIVAKFEKGSIKNHNE